MGNKLCDLFVLGTVSGTEVTHFLSVLFKS